MNATSNPVVLKFAAFHFCDMNHSVFRGTASSGISFFRTSLNNSIFHLNQLEKTSFAKSILRQTTWRLDSQDKPLFLNHIDFTDTNLIDSKFIKASYESTVDFERADLDRNEIFDLKLSPNFRSRNVSLRKARFVNATFDSTLWIYKGFSSIIHSVRAK